jgi:L-fuculose-phosphate aldolase
LDKFVNHEERQLREQLVDAMVAMAEQGLNHGTAGNVSVRFGDQFLVSPSGVPAEQLSPEMMVLVNEHGEFVGDFKPTSEWRMHTGLLIRREDVSAIVHCHSRFATTLACAHKTIPPLHYMTSVTGAGEILLAPYATFGSQELADGIAATLRGRYACLMANHGQIALGKTIDEALSIASEVEVQASYYYGTLAIGGPQVLPDSAIDEVLEKFQTYGQVKDT